MIKRLILPVPNSGDNTGVVYSYLARIKSDMINLGYDVILIKIDHPSTLVDLFRELDKGPSILFSLFFSDLRFSAQNHFFNTSISEVFPVSVFFLCSDMPYKSFMRERLVFSQGSIMMLTDPSYESLIKEISPKSNKFSSVENYVFDASLLADPIPWQHRDIDVLVPMSMQRTQQKLPDLLATLPEHQRNLVQSYYDAVRDERLRCPFEIFKEVYRAVSGNDLLETTRSRHNGIFEFCKLMCDVDNIVRTERRIRMVGDLLAETGPCQKIIVLGERTDLGPRTEQVTWAGAQRAPAMRDLMRRSRMVVNTHPVVPHGIHERVADTLASQTVLVTDENQRIKDTLEANKHYLPAGAGHSMASVMDGRDLEEIAQAGRSFAMAHFTPEHHAAYLDRTFRAFTS